MLSVSAMDRFVENQRKKTRKRGMSREKRILANKHERERVRKMNVAYEELRSTIPCYEEVRAKTKLELLRIAINYIKRLKGHPQSVNALAHPTGFGVENGANNLKSWSSECTYQRPVPDELASLSHLPLRHFPHHQTTSGGSQFPVSLRGNPDSLDQELSSHFNSIFVDSYAEESFLSNLQNSASILYTEDHRN